MPAISYASSHKPIYLPENEEPKTWNTNNYLRKLSGDNNDIIFTIQVNLTTDYH